MSSTRPNATRRLWLLPVLLLACAAIYYGLYLRFWFSLTNEGGTGAITAMRILNGERPLRDLALGYNVLWFYPIAALFKITGPNFLAMRAFFFALSTLAALAGYGTVRLITGRAWLGFAAGLLMIVYPGTQFKNYIPLLVGLNTWMLVRTFRREDDRWKKWIADAAAGGVVLGLTFLTRIDLGIFFFVLWLGALALHGFDCRREVGKTAGQSLAAFALIVLLALATHVPFYLVARAQGFADDFVGQYTSWFSFFPQTVSQTMRRLSHPAVQKPAVIESESEVVADTPARAKVATPTANRSTLPRTALRAAKKETMALAFLTYAPFVVLAIFIPWTMWEVLRKMIRREFRTDSFSFLLLLVLGGALTAFPQFFFFRPDRPHLSEFMANFLVGSCCCAAFLFNGRRWREAGLLRWIVLLFLALHASLYGWFAMGHPSAGTIAARAHRHVFFQGDNGVRVYVTPQELTILEGTRRAVLAHSRPGEYLVCYPYQPGINLMTNRLSCEKNLYVDNVTRASDFNQAAVERIERHRPAVIVIDDRPINQIEDSRFSRWAAPVLAYIRAHYHAAGTFGRNEVYVRDPVSPPIAP